ncbi:MAG: hypothetical protein U1E65_00325 [Myxococcota bacterium]
MGRRFAWCCLVLLGLGCQRRVELSPWPEVPGAQTFLYLRSNLEGVEAQVLDPGQPLPVIELDSSTKPEVVILAYAEAPAALGLALGPLALVTGEVPFPEALPPGATVYVLHPEAQRFDEAGTPPTWVSNLRRSGHDPCVQRTTENGQLGHGQAVRISLELDAAHALLAGGDGAWIMTTTSATPVLGLPFEPYGGALAEDGRIYVAGEGKVAIARIVDHRWIVDETLADDRTESVLGMVVEGDHRILILTQSGLLRRFQGGSWTQVGALDPSFTGDGGDLRRLSNGLILGVSCGSGSALVISATDIQTRPLISGSVGVCAVEEVPGFGLLLGTSVGQILAESTQFQALPEIPGHGQRGAGVLAIRRTARGIVVFAGQSGAMGELTADGRVCKYDGLGTWSGRSLTAVGDQLLATGFALENNPNQLSFTRILGVN